MFCIGLRISAYNYISWGCMGMPVLRLFIWHHFWWSGVPWFGWWICFRLFCEGRPVRACRTTPNTMTSPFFILSYVFHAFGVTAFLFQAAGVSMMSWVVSVSTISGRGGLSAQMGCQLLLGWPTGLWRVEKSTRLESRAQKVPKAGDFPFQPWGMRFCFEVIEYRPDLNLIFQPLQLTSLRLGTWVNSCCFSWRKLPWSWRAVGSWLCCCCRCSWADMTLWGVGCRVPACPRPMYLSCSFGPGFRWPATAFRRKLEWWLSRLWWWLGPSLPAQLIRSTNLIACADWLGKLSCRWKPIMRRQRCRKMRHITMTSLIHNLSQNLPRSEMISFKL